ncbi:MAG: DNA methyltransferase [Devosia sp.]
MSAQGRSPQQGQWESFEADHRTYYLTTLGNGGLQALIPLALNFRTSDDYKPRFGRTVIRGDLWKGFHQDMGNVAKEGGIAFANGKKPVRLIKQFIKWANNTQNGIVLDFFAGSGTTAQAVMELSAEDGGNRQYILVQLDEMPDPKSDAAKQGYRSIAQLTRERVRRAGNDLLEGNKRDDWNADVGFRALRIDTSNMAETYYAPRALNQSDLLETIENVKPDRANPEDLLFQVLVDWGVDLTLPIRKETILGRTVIFVSNEPYDLIACFDAGVTEELVKELAGHKPLRVVFRDNGFVSDAVKINVDQIFAQLSPSTDVKSI